MHNWDASHMQMLGDLASHVHVGKRGCRACITCCITCKGCSTSGPTVPSGQPSPHQSCLHMMHIIGWMDGWMDDGHDALHGAAAAAGQANARRGQDVGSWDETGTDSAIQVHPHPHPLPRRLPALLARLLQHPPALWHAASSSSSILSVDCKERSSRRKQPRERTDGVSVEAAQP